MSNKLAVARVVLAVVDPRVNNGSDVAPALVTSLKVDEKGKETGRVNLRVFLDTGADQRLTNVEVLDARPDETPDSSTTDRVAFWPPRS